jgi:DNA polymerase III alpha subunit
MPGRPSPARSYAELHCHTNFSFLDGASAADELVDRAVELGLSALAVTDHQGLYGVVRFSTAAREAGLHPVIGLEVELLDAFGPDPDRIVVPRRRSPRRGRGHDALVTWDGPRSGGEERVVEGGIPARPRPERDRLPGHRDPVREDGRGVGEAQRGPHLVLLARDRTGYRSLCRLVSRANLAGTKGMPRFSQALLREHAEGLVALSGCRDGEIARRLRVGDRAGARAVAEGYARSFGRRPARGTGGVAASGGVAAAGFVLELQHHLLPDDDWLVAETVRLAEELGLPVVVTNDVHYALPEGRELQDVVTAIRHGRTVGTLADLRRPDGESYLKSERELLALPPADPVAAREDPRTARAWAEGIANSGELAAACEVDLGFEAYRFPGFAVPGGETPFSYLAELCHEGARRRYHPMTPPVVRQLAHELEVIERTGLAEFFLICWDLMRFARERGIPAQGRGSAADSIVAYVLGITRVDPIRHNLLFERFINEGRTTYPDVDIDFSSERREEVIQYVYERYGPEHTGMVCNVVTYRARSVVREVGVALGFPRPLVDRVAKALETYDSVMVRRDLEADGGFAEFFRRPGDGAVAGSAALSWADAPGDPGEGAVPYPDPRARAAESAPGDPVQGARAVPYPSHDSAEHEVGGEGRAALARPGGFGPDVRAGMHRQDDGAVGRGPTEAIVRLGRGHVLGTGMGGISGATGPGRIGSAHLRALEDPARARGLTDRMGQLNHARGGRIRTGGQGERDDGRLPRPEDARRAETSTANDADHGPGSGTWPTAAGSRPSIRAGGPGDDEGGPGDSPASVAWLRSGRGTGYSPTSGRNDGPLATIDGREIDPESGALLPPARRTDRLGRPLHWDTGSPGAATRDAALIGGGDRARDGDRAGHSSVARVEPRPSPQPRGGSTVGMSDWERWLELCARMDGFPRHLSIHSGGMLITAAPLIDIAPLERATMKDRVVVQYDKRDVETIRLIKLDLLGLGMLAAIDETLQRIERDCATCVDLDRLPEEIPEVFEMLQAADTVGVFQVESRAQMQTLPKSRPASLDDLVVEVAIIRPGPIQGNAVHPYLRRKQGLEPVTYLHPSLEPILCDSLGVILYQEQVMRVAIEVAGFSAAESDGFRRAMGTWRSTREMEKLHRRFVDGCLHQPGMNETMAEELFRQVAAFASFGFAKSHAAAFARTAYESAFLKLFYPAQFLAGLVNAQPMGFYPVEVLVNDAKRHGVAVLPVDVNASAYLTTTEWVGLDPDPLPPEAGIDHRPPPVRSLACVIPSDEARHRWAAESATGWGVRLGLGLVKGIGEEHAERLDAELARGPYRSLADVVQRTALPEEVIERLIRAGGLDVLGRPRRELLWQLREVMGASGGRIDGRATRTAARASRRAAGRPMDMRLPATPAPELPPIGEVERLGDAYAVISLDARRQVIGLFREALERLGAIPNSALNEHRPGSVRIGGLVVTRQHPMTARGTVFLALEDETGMVNVTLWPDAWARLRGVVRRHALLLVDGTLQREGAVVNVVAREVRPLPEAAAEVGGPARPPGIRQLGWAGMRRMG